MRKLKLTSTELQEIVQKTIQSLQSSKTNVTISLSSLTNLGKAKDEDRPTVKISKQATAKMKALVNTSAKEIAWHGTVSKENNTYTIHNILVYPQLVTAATVESDDDTYAQWLDGLDDRTFNSIRMQGHSHVNMAVSPSGTDDDFYELLTQHINDYYIFIILNKAGKMWINIYDMEQQLIFDTSDIDIVYQGYDYNAWAEEQTKAHVQEYKSVSVVTTYAKTSQTPAPPEVSKSKEIPKHSKHYPDIEEMTTEELYEDYLKNRRSRRSWF